MNDIRCCDPKTRREFQRSSDHATRRSEFRVGVIAVIGLTAALPASLAGCHASSPRARAPDRAPPPELPAPAAASYDWHGLLIAPFGSMLKEIPLTLHEVLLFRDEAHAAPAGEEAECYTGDAPPPRFVGRTPDEYLLCFEQDRLSRVQASVRLTAAEAPELFAAACARWSKQQPLATASASPSDAAQGPATCEGHDGAIHFSGHLESQPAHAQSPEEEQVLSITLDSPPAP